VVAGVRVATTLGGGSQRCLGMEAVDLRSKIQSDTAISKPASLLTMVVVPTVISNFCRETTTNREAEVANRSWVNDWD